jgi:tartrate dehydrogenase/decarboxylase/D-malate dehydrogenase
VSDLPETGARTHRIAVIAGDGVGPEVVCAGLRVLEAAAAADGGFALAPEPLPWGSAFYAEHGRMMPANAIDALLEFDAIYLGAVGSPSVPDHVTLWGLLLPIRQRLDLYVNLRPVRLFSGVSCPLRGKRPEDIDIICVRENSEGEYSGVGGRVHEGLAHDLAIQNDVFTRRGVERIARHAFALAASRRGRLASITKSNAGRDAFVFWDEIVAGVAQEFPRVAVERILVDAAAAYFVTRPESFDVVVGSNLFMDILTDLGAAIQGGMGLAASANVNPEGGVPGMFEPVHGSAPDIAGKGIANPIGAVWAGALMLEQLGEASAAGRVMAAVERVLADPSAHTPDLGGSASTAQITDALVSAVDAGCCSSPG